MGKFESSTVPLMLDLVRFGPTKYEFVAVYESVALRQLEDARSQWGRLRVLYPKATIWADHPAVVLNFERMTDAERRGVSHWLNYLQSAPMQQLARNLGFRSNVPLADGGEPPNATPVEKLAWAGVRSDLPPAAPPATVEMAQAMQALWRHVVQAPDK
jgi:hypothetical protein